MTDPDDVFGDLGDDLEDGDDEEPDETPAPEAEGGGRGDEPATDRQSSQPVTDGAAEPATPADDTGRTSERPDTTTEAPGAEPTRERERYTAYLPPEQLEAVDDRFEDLNARRRLEDEPEIEKNKGFNEAIFRLFLERVDDEELLRYVPEYGYADE